MKQITTRRFLQFAGIAAAGFLLAACGKQEPPPAPAPVASAPAPAPAPPARVYAIGTDAAYAPFESQNEKAEIVGFDIDVAKAVAAKAGIEVKFINTPWEGIFNALGQGDRDMIASAVTITEERKQTMDFSDPYFDAQQLIAVKEGSKVTKPGPEEAWSVCRPAPPKTSHHRCKDQHQYQALREHPAGTEGAGIRWRGRRGGRQRRGHPPRGQQPGRQVQDRGRQGLCARAIRLCLQEGQ
jgi:ABC-type amino acid transport substrate-binding protein